jgi:hypothetical protein
MPEPTEPKVELDREEMERAAQPIIAATLTLRRERDEAREAFNKAQDDIAELKQQLAAEVQKTAAAMQMLDVCEDRVRLAMADIRSDEKTHGAEILKLQLELKDAQTQIDSVVTACLNVVKSRGVEVAENGPAIGMVGPAQRNPFGGPPIDWKYPEDRDG